MGNKRNNFMSWYKNTIKRYCKENVGEIIASTLFSLIILLWCFFKGAGFETEKISSISQPSIFHRLLYSALVYVTLGAFLFWTKFYKLLYWLFVKLLGKKKLHKEVKRRIWIILIVLMYFVIVPWVVDILNGVISFFYNILNFVLYLYAPLGISLIALVGFFIFKKYQKTRK